MEIAFDLLKGFVLGADMGFNCDWILFLVLVKELFFDVP